MIRAEILSTGDEIMSGSLVDTNAAWITRQLLQSGLEVGRISCAGDDLRELQSLIQEIAQRADIAVVTGGLGPTPDDITAEAAAKACGVELEQNRQALQSIEDYFARLQRPMPESNLKQALIPAGSVCLPNPAGTAPGFRLNIHNCCLFALPGVPSEMKQMFDLSVTPWIKKHLAQQLQPMSIRVISCFGISESKTAQALQGFSSSFPDIHLGFRFKFPAIQARLYCRQPAGRTYGQHMEDAVNWVKHRLGDRVFSSRDSTLQEETMQLLADQNKTLAILEGCSGGMLAHLATGTEAGSKALLLARVVHEDFQGFSRTHVDPLHSARELASEIMTDAESDFGLVNFAAKEADQTRVFMGLAGRHRTLAREFTRGYPDRQASITALSWACLNLLRLELLEVIPGNHSSNSASGEPAT